MDLLAQRIQQQVAGTLPLDPGRADVLVTGPSADSMENQLGGDQAPLAYDRLQDEAYDPRYAFGHGLSYTRFDDGGLDSSARGDDVRVSLSVRNRGRRAGEHTVLLFAGKRGASEAFAASRLVAYRKLRYNPATGAP